MMETYVRPVWLLDFDGVLNTDRKGKWPRLWNSFASTGHYFRWAPEVVRQIHRIHNTGMVEIRWATTWCSRAEVVEKTLGLPSFSRAFFDCYPGALVEKQNAAREVIRSGRPLIWTDDQVIPKWGAFNDDLINAGSLLISTDSMVGLQPEDIQAIKEFIGYMES